MFRTFKNILPLVNRKTLECLLQHLLNKFSYYKCLQAICQRVEIGSIKAIHFRVNVYLHIAKFHLHIHTNSMSNVLLEFVNKSYRNGRQFVRE